MVGEASVTLCSVTYHIVDSQNGRTSSGHVDMAELERTQEPGSELAVRGTDIRTDMGVPAPLDWLHSRSRIAVRMESWRVSGE